MFRRIKYQEKTLVVIEDTLDNDKLLVMGSSKTKCVYFPQVFVSAS